MAEIAHGMIYTPARPRFGLRDLSRLAAWGLIALGALTLATYAASTELGKDRLILAVANFQGVPPPERLARTPADIRNRQLAETLRELAADRAKLASRLDTLERSVGDMTGSIARIAAPSVASIPWPAPAISAPEAQQVAALPFPAPVTTAPSTPATTSATAPVPAPDVPLPRAAAPHTPPPEEAAKPEFGIDLGRANSVEGLRQLWTTLKGRHGAALDGLRPIVAVREIPRTNGVEVRLVAGPIPNAATAARLCANLPGVACHPTVFDGQKLALR